MCRRSSAAVPPVKYKSDFLKFVGIFKIENIAYGEINEWSFSNPTPNK